MAETGRRYGERPLMVPRARFFCAAGKMEAFGASRARNRLYCKKYPNRRMIFRSMEFEVAAQIYRLQELHNRFAAGEYEEMP